VLNLNNKLGKIYSLKSKIIIDSLFENGEKVSLYPYTVFFKKTELKENVPFKLVFSAPKRTFKNAYQRNRIKRLMKEAVRTNKHNLETYLNKNKIQLSLFLIYSTKDELNHSTIQKKTVKLFDKIIKQSYLQL
jgi:ribonuclease P protein component